MADQEISELRNRILGIRIRSIRDQVRASRRDCAAVLGVPVSRFASYEDGTRAISLPELELLSRYLEVPLQTFRTSDSLNEDSTEPQLPSPEQFLPLRHRVVGARLRQLRKETERTQADVAEMLGCSTSTISDYEYGRRGIAVSDLEVIGRGMGVTLDYFLDDESEVGTWHRAHTEFEQFERLSPELREFVLKEINRSYVELAMRLAKMPGGQLRTIAEGLLEITY
jgi:transcriptional regulator with XRE-family HTH domain